VNHLPQLQNETDATLAHRRARQVFNSNFWQPWQAGFRIPFLASFTLLLVLCVALFIAMWRSPAPTVTWQYWQERETQAITTHQFQTGPFLLQTKADNAILFERLNGSDFAIPDWPVYAYLLVMVLAFAMMLAVVSSLSRFWFMLGYGFIIFFIANLQLEVLAVLGQSNLYPAASLIVLLVVVGLIFQYYWSAASFALRWFIFLMVLGSSIAALAAMATIPAPLYFIAVNFIPATVVACVFLVLFTAHEWVALIVLLVSKFSKGTNGFTHFAVLSGIYLANLIAMYLSRLDMFAWEFSIHPVILMASTAVLAVWGVMRQQAQMEGFILPGPLAPLGVLSLAIVAMGGTAFFYTAGHDAAIETISNFSLYAHIGFGLVFALYVIANFAEPLKQNMAVMQVLFRPKFMQFFTFRLAGTIAVLGFVVVVSWRRPIFDTKGARDAAIGDYYALTGNITLAKGFYEKSDQYAFHNHHANYVLANIHRLLQEPSKERMRYSNAAERRPTMQAQINALEAMHDVPLQWYTYVKALEAKYPQNGIVQNELGFALRKLKQPDSAFLIFDGASRDKFMHRTAQLNKLGMATAAGFMFKADSMAATVAADDYNALTNAYALANKTRVVLSRKPKPLPDTVLNVFGANYLANALLNQAQSPDTSFITHAVSLAHKPVNNAYAEEVLVAAAHAAYASGQINQAFQWLQEASVGSDHQGRHNNTMALWALDQQMPAVAQGYAQFSVNQSFDEALLTQAIAHAEQGNRAEAIILFDSLQSNKDLTVVAESMLRILAGDKKFLRDFNDLERYAYCRYRLDFADSVEFNTVVAGMQDADWQARAILDRSINMYAWDEIYASVKLFNLFNGIAMSNADLIAQISRHEMLLQAALGNINFLQSRKQSGWTIAGEHEADRVYYDGLLAQTAGDSTTAKSKFLWIAKHNSFFDLGVVAAANISRHNPDRLYAYTLLATALQNNPQSVRLLKAYIQEAKRLTFDDFAQSGLQTLQQVLPEPLYKKFITSLPD
jgi:dihydrofolate reductase